MIDWVHVTAYVVEKAAEVSCSTAIGEWEIDVYFSNYPPCIMVEGCLMPKDARRAIHYETGHARNIKDEEFQQIAQFAAEIATKYKLKVKRVRMKDKVLYSLRPDYSRWEIND